MLLNFLYCAALWIASPLVIYRAARFGRYRRGVRQKCLGLSHDDLEFESGRLKLSGAASVAWFHAVSVGEVNLITGLVREFRAAHPDDQVVVSTSTDTGYDLAKSRFHDLTVFFCPLDFTWSVNRTFATLRPRVLVLADLELWPNLTRLAGQWGSLAAAANARPSQGRSTKCRRFSGPLVPTEPRLE